MAVACVPAAGLDQLLLYFARYPLQELQPRGTTGTVRTWISGNALCLAHNERHVAPACVACAG